MIARQHKPFQPPIVTAPATPAVAEGPGPNRGRRPGSGFGRLQQSHGNQAVQALLGAAVQAKAVQAKAATGNPGDRWEREADRIAQRLAGTTTGLDDLRIRMEQATGADLSGVHLHTDFHADNLNRGAGSLALTRGRDIFFRAGQYAPHTSTGRALIAHEMTHVAQQSGDAGAPAVQHFPGSGTISRLRDREGWELKGLTRRLRDERLMRSLGDGADSDLVVTIRSWGDDSTNLHTALQSVATSQVHLDPKVMMQELDALIAAASTWLGAHASDGRGTDGDHRDRAKLVQAIKEEAAHELSYQITVDAYGQEIKKRKWRERLLVERDAARHGFPLRDRRLTPEKRDLAIASLDSGERILPALSQVMRRRMRDPDIRYRPSDPADAPDLTKAEAYAVYVYTAQDYKYINPAMANDPSWQPQNADSATRATAAELVRDGRLHGGIANAAMRKLPVTGTDLLYRGMRGEGDKMRSAIRSMVGSGKPHLVGGILSASRKKATAWAFARRNPSDAPENTTAVMIEFRNVPAHDISPLSAVRREDEEVILPGTVVRASTPQVLASSTLPREVEGSGVNELLRVKVTPASG
ncbi:DUF4157 domain-containing protein [Dactylosporangium sp. NPDC051485]|uniref:eCIS core domain-containing protein n=1 Tax=Dactylosporangium sp. NPDC051485 TaxID=3154846 RepID=UPI00341A4C4C